MVKGSKKIAFKGPRPKTLKTRRTIQVKIRDSDRPLVIFEFDTTEPRKKYEDEYEDIIRDLVTEFDRELHRILRLPS